MTAIVGVLNKHAIAIAADSAVTLGNTHKVINCGNKIFTLSKYHPIAIMTYNNAAFMGTPWDIIIKQYRKELNRSSFETVEKYMIDFLSYIKKNSALYSNTIIEKQILSFSLFNFLLSALINEKTNELNDHKSINEQISNLKKRNSGELSHYSYKAFLKFISAELDQFINLTEREVRLYINRISDFHKIQAFYKQNKDLVLSLCYHYYVSEFPLNNEYTGLVFTGYGENEIYPSLFSIQISGIFDGNIKYRIDNRSIIGKNGIESSIIPFAQSDVVHTILSGIHPDFINIIENVINTTTSELKKAIVSTAKDFNKDMASSIENIDMSSTIENISGAMKKVMKTYYTDPLLSTLKNLDKEDMANMAESFVALTSLIRRMSPHEETVGGPIDVAVISKGDGFIWIKRKHYFSPELNNHFFSNYYNE